MDVLKSEWEKLVEENERLKAENKKLINDILERAGKYSDSENKLYDEISSLKQQNQQLYPECKPQHCEVSGAKLNSKPVCKPIGITDDGHYVYALEPRQCNQ